MKVFCNGLNIHRQISQFESPKLESFQSTTIDKLQDIEVSYAYSVSEYGGKLIFKGAVEDKFENLDAVAQIACTENSTWVLHKNGSVSKISLEASSGNVFTSVVKDVNVLQLGIGVNIAMGIVEYSSKPSVVDVDNLRIVTNTSDRKIVEVKTGREHAVLLDSKGNVYSLGHGRLGQLGHGDLEDVNDEPKLVEALGGIEIVSIAAGGWHSCAVSKHGDVYTWGWNENGQLGLGDGVSTMATPQFVDVNVDVKKVACGSRHTVVLLDNGQLHGCGWNKYNQLCCGDDSENIYEMTYLHDFSNENVVNIKCGPWNSLVLCE